MAPFASVAVRSLYGSAWRIAVAISGVIWERFRLLLSWSVANAANESINSRPSTSGFCSMYWLAYLTASPALPGSSVSIS